MKLLWALALLFGCGAAADDEPLPVAPCVAAPDGYRAQAAGEWVRVSRPLGGAFVGGATLRSEARVVDPAALPAVVDFGDTRVEVRPDLSLCLVTSAPAE